jgi:hypothetical protein
MDATAYLFKLFCIASLVVEEGRTQAADLARALGMLKDTPLLGTVLNKTLHRGELH